MSTPVSRLRVCQPTLRRLFISCSPSRCGSSRVCSTAGPRISNSSRSRWSKLSALRASGSSPRAVTLKAAGLLDVDAGETVRPGIVRVEDDRIVGIGECPEGTQEGEIIDLGDSILLPGLMDMEVNL